MRIGEIKSGFVVLKVLRAIAFLCLLLILPISGLAQNTPKISAAIDTASIKIGEQIQYKITVEADSTDIVHFPEGQTFSPLETVEALMIDSTKNKDKVILQRIYALTQFDSGAYTIPRQRIAVNEQPFFTDSFQIKVADVVVDTTKQKMYDIKPLIKVEKDYAKIWWIIFWVLLTLAIIGGLVYWFFLRKKPLTEEEKEALLPAYDRALLELKKLENSRYLIQDEYKKYYSELTDIVRSYLEEDVNVSAMESTTSELITKLEMLKDSGELSLEEDTIRQFQKILQTADLVKFAKSKPAVSIAEQDRKLVEDIVIKTHEALPEPTEEELLLNEEYLEELARKKQRKRIYWAAAIFIGILFLGSGLSIAYFGFKEVRDTVFGHPTKELLEGEWVASSYGYPPVLLETPEVLTRDESMITPEIREQLKDISSFHYGSAVGLFSVRTSSTIFKDGVEPNFEKTVEFYLKGLESQGAKNIIVKQEEFFTKSGVPGLKTYGTGSFKLPVLGELPKSNYILLNFGGTGFMQQIEIFWMGDDSYSKEIVEKILANIDVKTQV